MGCEKEGPLFIVCKKCRANTPENVSSMEYQRIAVFTNEETVTIWCIRHDEQIISFKLSVQEQARHGLISRVCDCCNSKREGEDQ